MTRESVPAHMAEDAVARRAFVADWIARHRKRVAAGFGGIALVLPLLAAAQAQEFVAAAGIEGVTNVVLGPDGSATLTLANGQSVIVPASDVQLVGDQILISAAAADFVAEAAAAAAVAPEVGAGAIMAGIAGVAAVGVALASSDDGTPRTTISPGEIAADGVLNLAAAQAPLIVDGYASNLPEGSTGRLSLRDADGAAVPGTTQTFMFDEDGNFSAEMPDDVLRGLEDGSYTVLLEVLDEEGAEVARSEAALVVDLTPPTVSIDEPLSGEDNTVNIAERDAPLVIEGDTDAEDGEGTVSLTLDGETYTGDVEDGRWSVEVPPEALAALEHATDYAITVVVEDAAGNPSEAATATLGTDFEAPQITIDPVAGDNTLTLVNVDRDVEVTGTTDAEPGNLVQVVFNGVALEPAEVMEGDPLNTWTATIPADQVTQELLETGETYSLTAEVTDTAGNPSETASVDLGVNFDGPSVSIAAVSDGFINAAEAADPVEISGSTTNADPGSPVVVTVTGAGVDLSFDLETDAQGDWRVEIDAPEASGETYTVTAVVIATIDGEEVPSPTAEVTFVTDYEPPELSDITVSVNGTALGAGDLLNAIQANEETITVSGTVSDNDGQPVIVSIDGISREATPDGSTFAVEFEPGALTGEDGLADGDYSFTVSTRDAAGNPAEAESETFTVDFTTDFTPVEVEILTIGDEGVAVAGEALVVTGTTNGDELDVVFEGETVAATIDAAAGTWSAEIPADRLADLPPGVGVGLTATGRSAAGNVGTAAGTVTPYLGSAFTMSLLSLTGSTAELAVETDIDAVPTGGFGISFNLFADPDTLTFLRSSDPEADDDAWETVVAGFLGFRDTTLQDEGFVSGGGLALPALGNLRANLLAGDKLVTTLAELLDPDAPFTVQVVTDDAAEELALMQIDDVPYGPSESLFGSEGADTLVATAVDSVIRGRGGDDSIDVSAGGVNTVVFEATSAANGLDTVTGFSLGAATGLPDRISITGLEGQAIRGTEAEIMDMGSLGALGASTGLLVFTTALAGDDEAAVRDVIEALDLGAGEVLYILAGDGTNASLSRLEMDGDGNPPADLDDVDDLASFVDIGDLSGFTGDNLFGFTLATT